MNLPFFVCFCSIFIIVSPLFAAIIDWLNEPNTVIAIDGSLYKNHTLLKKLLRDYTAELTGRKKMFDIILAHDGSGKGKKKQNKQTTKFAFSLNILKINI